MHRHEGSVSPRVRRGIARAAFLVFMALPLAPAAGADHAPFGQAAPLGGSSAAPFRVDAVPFRVEGAAYIARGFGRGTSEAEAVERARGAALRALFQGLGKDRLFAEIFVKDPPIGLVFTTLTVGRAAKPAPEGDYEAEVALRVDDESIRIVARGPYLAAALSLLDGAEAELTAAEGLLEEASRAEGEARLGEALGAYGRALDRLVSGFSLIDPLEDGSVFSAARGRGAPELKRLFAAAEERARKGIDRARAAEAALERDAAGREAEALVARALAAVADAEALLVLERAPLSEPSAYGPERLASLRDRLDLELRSLRDTRAALVRGRASLAERSGYLADKFAFALRRLDSAETSLAAARRAVDRELRDPAVRRAARARLVRGIFLHEPTESLALRAAGPLGLALDQGESAYTAALPFDLALRAEGAFPFGSGGLWLATGLASGFQELSAMASGLERSLGSSFDLGFWGRRGLLFAGYGWDWMRAVDGGGDEPKNGSIRLGLGGVSRRHGDGAREALPRADWLLAFSYELPISESGLYARDVLNGGLEGRFRLGSLALLEAAVAHRVHRDKNAPGGLDAVLSWSLALGLRLPPPFTWGLEYRGSRAWALDAEGGIAGGERKAESLRLFLEYAL